MAPNCDVATLSIKHRLNRNSAHPHNFAAVIDTSLCDHTRQNQGPTTWLGVPELANHDDVSCLIESRADG